ncbi:MAG: LamG domain-containing protein [Verrucomicrobia bacterium]|nr:LamG domain-containing protein [Verrucomicrobiota bacterium]
MKSRIEEGTSGTKSIFNVPSRCCPRTIRLALLSFLLTHCVAVAAEPQLRFQFPEGGGTETSDSQGNVRLTLGNLDPNTVTRPTWSNEIPYDGAKGNHSLLFDKEDFASAIVSNDIAAIFSRPFTITAWVKLTGESDIDLSSSTVLSIWYAQNKLFSFEMRDLNKGEEMNGLRPILAFMGKDEAPRTLYASRKMILPLGEWTFIAASYDGSKATFYVNGITSTCGEEVNADQLSPVESFADPELRMGRNTSNTEVFPFMVSDVRVFASALSESEIEEVSSSK